MSDLPKPGFVRAKTFEEMTPYERELYTPRRRRDDDLSFMCRGTEYNPLHKFDNEMPSCHREKDD